MCVRMISDISLRFVLCQNKGEVAFDLFDHSIYLSGVFKCSAYLREAVDFLKTIYLSNLSHICYRRKIYGIICFFEHMLVSKNGAKGKIFSVMVRLYTHS